MLRMLLSFVLLACVIYIGRCVRQSGSQAIAPAHGSGVGHEEIEKTAAQAIAVLDDIQRGSKARIDDALRMQRSDEDSDGVRGALSRDSEWMAFPRESSDLAVAMLTGRYGWRTFVRHPVLNPMDMPISRARLTEFENLVAKVQASGQPCRAAVARAALGERSRLLSVKSYPHIVATDAEVRAAEEELVRNFAAKGRDITMQDARTLLSKGEAFSVNLRANQSFIGGKKYDNQVFGQMPGFESAFELVRQVALQEWVVISGWFAGYGYAVMDPAVVSVCIRIDSMPAHDVSLHVR